MILSWINYHIMIYFFLMDDSYLKSNFITLKLKHDHLKIQT
jgi:hypothetical protein